VDPAAELAELEQHATGEIFSFSRPAPQPDGSEIRASFECTLMNGTDELGAFLCRHLVPEAVWNEHTTNHPNQVQSVAQVRLPVSRKSLEMLADIAGTDAVDDLANVGSTTLRLGPAEITFDRAVPTTEIEGVLISS
jgi:hypothetical protein